MPDIKYSQNVLHIVFTQISGHLTYAASDHSKVYSIYLPVVNTQFSS